VGKVISKIKVGKQVFENPRFLGFGTYGTYEDGFLMVIEDSRRKYAVTLSGKVYNIIEKGSQLFIEVPYGGGRVYRAPLRFKL
jgi:uncharacterized protein (AIM24 family)